MAFTIDKNTIRSDYAIATFKTAEDDLGVTVNELLTAIAEFVEKNPGHYAIGDALNIEWSLGLISDAVMPPVNTEDLNDVIG